MIPTAVAAALVLPVSVSAADHDGPSTPTPPALRSELAGHATVGAQMRAAGRDLRRARLVRANIALARRLARLEGEPAAGGRRRSVARLSLAALREHTRALGDRLALVRREARAAAATPPHLAAIAACESGGDPAAIGGGGLYRGKYQFSLETWQSVGGTGDPAAASEAEQDRRAAILYARAGAAPWPVCG